MKIYLTAKQVNMLKEEEEKREIPFEEFFVNAKNFLKDLLTKPYEAELPSIFKMKGYTKDDIISAMKKIGLLKSEENIIEVPVNEGKLRAKHTIKYKIPKQRFMDKLRELHKELFSEATFMPSVFDDEEAQIEVILQNDVDGAYRTRGGIGRNF